MKKKEINKNIAFLEYFREVMEERVRKNQNCFNYNIALKHLERFTGGKIGFHQITERWFGALNSYLKKANGLRCRKVLSTNAADTYFKVIISVARQAADDRHIDHCVFNNVPITTRVKAGSTHLTFDELNKLASTTCKQPILKAAFLFSCLTGLGWKEIETLKWNNLRFIDGTWHVTIQNAETTLAIPLNSQAVSLLGKIRNDDSRVFCLHYSAALCVNLNKWALHAGVFKQITFSCAKQSFGRALLDSGVPIELISELLGHRHVKSTIKLLDYKQVKESPTTTYLRAFSI